MTNATNIVAGNEQQRPEVQLRGHGDGQVASFSRFASISQDGATVGFMTHAENLGGAARAGAPQWAPQPPPRPKWFYVHEVATGRTQLVGHNRDGSRTEDAPSAFVSPDGRYALFATDAPTSSRTTPTECATCSAVICAPAPSNA
ncbi:hypothetical protein [Streptomyces sp. A5-4]|uniref:hypothetical protein n=1 Tax=Streptomyces sp. A5-4 TaxID=3384771 RepID=UPI003DA9440C